MLIVFSTLPSRVHPPSQGREHGAGARRGATGTAAGRRRTELHAARAYVRSDRVELTGVTLWMCRSRWRRRTVGDSKKVKAVRPVHVGLDSGLSAAPPGGGQ